MVEPFAADFAQDVAFELYMLSVAAPIAFNVGQTLSATLSLHGGPKQITVGVSTTLGLTVQGALAKTGLQPILFGSAWKVLDVLADHIMCAGAVPHRIPIAQKTNAATGGKLRFSPMDAYPALDKRVWAAYANAEQYRHSLVHRRASVAANGDFIGTDSKGVVLRSMSAGEQYAFCRTAQWVAAFVACGSVQKRAMHRLAAELDELTTLTNLPRLGYPVPPKSIPKVTIPVMSTDLVEMAFIKRLARGTFDANEIDVIFEVLDRQAVRYLCELEDVPDASLKMDENTNVPWLQPI